MAKTILEKKRDELEEIWASKKEAALETIKKMEQKMETIHSAAGKALIANVITAYRLKIDQREGDLSLFQMVVDLDKRIRKLELERGKRAEDRKLLKNVDNFLKILKRKNREAERDAMGMYG